MGVIMGHPVFKPVSAHVYHVVEHAGAAQDLSPRPVADPPRLKSVMWIQPFFNLPDPNSDP